MIKKYDLHLILNAESAHKKIINTVQKDSVVLEIGTSYGHMTQYLKEELNCQITGIEIDPEAAKEALKYTVDFLNIDIDDTQLLDEKIKDNYYDYIVMCDVIEHVKETESILKVLGKKLKTSGLFLLSVPNVAHNIVVMQLLKNDFDYQDIGMMDNTHIRWFTSESFKKKIDQAGLRLVKHDWTYMTPEFENVSHNNYNDFSLFEREVLLRHPNCHFFQNIFHLSKDLSIEEGPINNIDAYWFDKIKINYPDLPEENTDVFDKVIIKSIKAINPKEIEDYSFSITPTMRMRGFKNVLVTGINNENNEVTIPIEVIDAIFIDDTYYSFANSKIVIKLTNYYKSIKISFEYVDVTDELVMNLLQRVK